MLLVVLRRWLGDSYRDPQRQSRRNTKKELYKKQSNYLRELREREELWFFYELTGLGFSKKGNDKEGASPLSTGAPRAKTRPLHAGS